MENTDILVAGGGAAGIMAALTATENGKGKIFIIEEMENVIIQIITRQKNVTGEMMFHLHGRHYKSLDIKKL